MKTKSITLTISLILLSFIACSADNGSGGNELPGPATPETIVLKLADSNATPETKALYSQLWAIQSKGFMFGHHDDLWYGRKWYNEPGRSDTKDVSGDYPAVCSIDFAEIMDDRYENNTANEIRRRVILEARRRGEVITACILINNPLTGGDSWDNSSREVAKEILKNGSETNIKFKTWLDRLAAFALNLKDDAGNHIPVLFRPFHEHTQTWSWWGSRCTTEQEFISLWRFTIEYLRDEKGVHNFIYAISPQMDTAKREEDFYFRWPGDNYVDFIGMDCYHGTNASIFAANLKSISAASKTKMKPCGVTETGVEGFQDKDFWSKQILEPATGRAISMIVMWRNKYDPQETGNHYFSVFKGHPSETDFRKMYANPLALFSADLPDMYTLAENITVE